MTQDGGEDRLEALRKITPPEPSGDARQRALAQAMLAFESNKTTSPKESPEPTQGSARVRRLMAIFNPRTWTMDIRIPVGTAALALLLLPLGYQLYTTTALTGPRLNPPLSDYPLDDVPPLALEPVPTEPANAGPEETAAQAAIEPEAEPLMPPEIAVERPEQAPLDAAPRRVQQAAEAPAAAPAQENSSAPMDGEADAVVMAPAPTTGLTFSESAVAPSAAPMLDADSFSMPAPSYTPTEASGDSFERFEESPVKRVAEEPVSTFSIDVDTASYSYVRRMLQDGVLPSPDAVRIEEMINYFPYDYPAATDPGTPFAPSIAVYPTPWNPDTQILHVGIKGFAPPADTDMASNLVFLIDTSGSMDEPDKLPLLKRAFGLLVDQLSPNDTVSIVVYAGSAGVVLEPTPASNKAAILRALDDLWAGGSTAGAEGIELAYQLAEQGMIEGGNNRVILATDGDFNVGISDPEALEDFIKTKRETGVFLSVLGFGRGNLDDRTMQALAQNGNGVASYIDSYSEARKVLVDEVGATLTTIARDVKIQVEFNPAFVSEYRLIGYETRALNREDFNNDRVDAGDVGAGHTVTALYEITPVGSPAVLTDPLRFGANEAPVAASGSDEIAFLRLRYKLPDGGDSRLLERPVTTADRIETLAGANPDVSFAAAVAAFGQRLKDSDYGSMDYDAIRALALSGRGADENGYRSEFVQLVDLAAGLDRSGKPKTQPTE